MVAYSLRTPCRFVTLFGSQRQANSPSTNVRSHDLNIDTFQLLTLAETQTNARSRQSRSSLTVTVKPDDLYPYHHSLSSPMGLSNQSRTHDHQTWSCAAVTFHHERPVILFEDLISLSPGEETDDALQCHPTENHSEKAADGGPRTAYDENQCKEGSHEPGLREKLNRMVRLVFGLIVRC